MNGQRLQVFDKLTYLGSALTRAVQVTDRLANARVAADYVEMSGIEVELGMPQS